MVFSRRARRVFQGARSFKVVKILVTGAFGLLGSRLANYILLKFKKKQFLSMMFLMVILIKRELLEI